MKRSEIEKIIEGIIDANLEIMVSEVPNTNLVSGLILYALEQKGMMPGPKEDCKCAGCCECWGSWEPE